jgi:hypothetical protein
MLNSLAAGSQKLHNKNFLAGKQSFYSIDDETGVVGLAYQNALFPPVLQIFVTW